MNDRFGDQGGLVHSDPQEVDSRATKQIRSRTPEWTRRRILEQARTLRHSNFAIGVEILTDHLVAVLTDPTGQNFGRRRRELTTHHLGGIDVETVVRNVAQTARELVATSLGVDLPHRNIAIGLQIGAPIDPSRRVVLHWRNPSTDPAFAAMPSGWSGPVPLADLVEAETGCPTIVENDATAYAAYELRFGSGHRSFAVILLRDGVGGGMVKDHGVMAIPFEIGHLTIHPQGRRCACGNQGCIEAYAGRRAIRGIVGERMGAPDADDLRVAIDLGQSNASVVEAFRQAGEAVARGIAMTLTTFGIEHVVIYCDPAMCGGNATKRANAAFFEGVGKYREFAFATYGKCAIEHKEWRSTDGALGAAMVALNQLFFVPLAESEPA